MSIKLIIHLITILLIVFIVEIKKKCHWQYMRLTEYDLKRYNSQRDINIFKPDGYWRSFLVTFKLYSPFFKEDGNVKQTEEILNLRNKNKTISKIYIFLIILLVTEYFVL